MTTDYRQFTKPAELHKAINMLSGIMQGLEADAVISDAELQELLNWCSLHENLRNRHPFTELLPRVDEALADGVLNAEEREDILWLCGKFSAGGTYYDSITSSLQVLTGVVHGMLADNDLNDAEIFDLAKWVADNDFLKGCYPFDEIDSLLTAVLADKIITEDERKMLMGFLGSFVEFKDSYNLIEADYAALRDEYSISGICAVCPDIRIDGKTFCVSGESYRASREEFMQTIEQHGGIVRTNVSSKTDYLVVGNAGNPCWAYACYGRKIEKAMQLRREGRHIQIVNETDFWDAI